ncbi:hypothetical protein [Flammeovirga sp. SubArs3]|uniref:lysophospholipid acyltransferase family protein n=1 Tax=Flammeovirga sp. SubArs3 TaxID=2995316 RepID=UPI00248C6735|nr:hypothetical protein [Flammeovirga sp. SubArs3]
MTKILYGLFIWPITILPFSVLYKISDFLYFVLYKLIGYRTTVVRTNLNNSFPEKSDEEIKEIESKFYRHLCDLICESFKMFNISEKELLERCVYDDMDLINKYKDRNLCIIGHHYNNFEYAATSATASVGRQISCLFSKLSNEFFNEKITTSRSQFGMNMIQKDYAKSFFESKHEKPIGLIFGADQSPTYSKKVIWTNFLNQETACFFGPEKYAKENDMVVIFTKITKVKRGYYRLNFELVTDQPLQEEHGFITEKHTRMLEKEIKKRPEYWLWTHKRWKRTREKHEEFVPATA